ncbi:hypothetical protein SEA_SETTECANDELA_206 [Mycobacterium phage Settecandela]|nr:hypothetical protein SEA_SETTECANDELA_206 [Mycobacterium phage Settecandela]
MSKFPTASVVSRGLRRDAGIITTPRDRQGYHVRGDGSYPASISVDLTDLPIENPNADVRGARDLHEHLTEAGWGLEPIDPDHPTFLNVLRVPTNEERRKAMAATDRRYALSFDKPGMMPITYRCADLDEALKLIDAEADRIEQGYTASVSVWRDES